MEKLEDYTIKQVSDALISRIAKRRNITKTQAKKLFINALTYTLVVNVIDEQVDFLLGIEEEQED